MPNVLLCEYSGVSHSFYFEFKETPRLDWDCTSKCLSHISARLPSRQFWLLGKSKHSPVHFYGFRPTTVELSSTPSHLSFVSKDLLTVKELQFLPALLGWWPWQPPVRATSALQDFPAHAWKVCTAAQYLILIGRSIREDIIYPELGHDPKFFLWSSLYIRTQHEWWIAAKLLVIESVHPHATRAMDRSDCSESSTSPHQYWSRLHRFHPWVPPRSEIHHDFHR
jgi:hypothetical protein